MTGWHRSTSQPPQVQLVLGREIARYVADWNRCYRATSAATPFSSPAWVQSWWRHYAPGREAVLVLRDGQRVAGVLPLVLRRSAGARVLGAAGEGLSDYHDVLVDDLAVGAWAALADGLQRVRGWDVLDLRQVPAASPLHQLAQHWPGVLLVTEDMSTSRLVLNGEDTAESLAARRSTSLAKRVRQTQRRADAAGVRRVLLPVTRRNVGQVLATHLQAWEGRPLNAEHATARFAAHLSEALPALALDGEVVLDRLVAGQAELLARVLFRRGRWMGTWLEGQGRDERSRHLQMTILGMATLLDEATEDGIDTLDLLRGLYAHKLRWQPEVTPTQRLVMARSRYASAPYLHAVKWRAWASRSDRLRAWTGRSARVELVSTSPATQRP